MGEAIIAVGLIVLAGIFLAGYSSGQSGARPSVTPSGEISDCTAACTNLIAKRAQTCAVRAMIVGATANRDSISAQLSRAIAASAVLLAAAIAVGFVPFIGGALAASLWSLWITSHLYVVFLLGQLAGAGSKLGDLNLLLVAALNEETVATALVRADCSSMEADRCISSLRPC